MLGELYKVSSENGVYDYIIMQEGEKYRIMTHDKNAMKLSNSYLNDWVFLWDEIEPFDTFEEAKAFMDHNKGNIQ